MAETPGSSEASAKRESPHNSMIDLNEAKSDIDPLIGQSVLDSKDFQSLDRFLPLGQTVPMAKNLKKSLSDYDLKFMARTWAARTAKEFSQAHLAEKLGGLAQDHYKQYETRGPLPYHLIEPFLDLTGVTYEYLFTDHGEGPPWRARYQELLQKQKPRRKVA